MILYAILDRPGEHEHVASWHGRCTYCGHRVGGWQWETRTRALPRGWVYVRVRPTREQPWRIPAEIIGRYRAMRQPQPPAPYDVDDEEDPDTLESMGLL